MLEQIPMTQIPRECECLCGRVCYLARAEGAIGSGRRREYLIEPARWAMERATADPDTGTRCELR